MNISFGTISLFNYLGFFLIYALIFIFFIFMKIKFCLDLFKKRCLLKNLDFLQYQKIKIKFFTKFIFLFFFILSFSLMMLTHYYFFLILFLYPIFQIFQNFQNTKKNFFSLKFNITFFLPQSILLLTLRGYSFSFTLLKPDYFFCFLIFGILFLQIFILFLQNHFGAFCFLPNFLNPYYFQYKKNLKFEQKLDKDLCPICFENFWDEELEEYVFLSTPCGHCFHVECLKDWMEVKYVCPCCRKNIPPYHF